MKPTYLAILIAALMMASITTYGQSCTQRLNDAEDDYEAGRLSAIPDKIERCLESEQFSKEEAVRARRLLTLVYIFTDQEAKAEGALINLLKEDPEHRLNPQVDPAELFFLYDQFRTAPIFRIAFRAGINSSSPNIIERYGTFNLHTHSNFHNGKDREGNDSYVVEGDSSSNDYNSLSGLGFGFQGEILFESHLGKGVELGIGPQLRLSQYNTDSYVNQPDLNSSLTNQQLNIRLPVLFRYTLNYDNRDQKWLPYVFLGGAFDYLLTAKYTEANRAGGTAYSISSSDLIASNQVNQYNYSFFGGVGTKMRVGTHFLTFELRYDMSQLNYINGENRYQNDESTFDLAFVEPDLSLNFLSVTLGYTLSVYQPKKLTK
ncbi:outer membrane beta-barrel protein [Marinoscillum furvescens]|uniref:Outer membrane protein with beta-barrel domain n=1 Tax=Marinoscillum furvescens DSM 4134 TaxID=1122208 RepID=A0A3D9L6Y8_MARFU|nr:outer membrane beta-barrel protein [Marinoscillum furvescens]REE02119.1 outer membrane protein with beta-barrel domain [Marinoscillum furvescens DSM 4134]